MDDIRQSPGTLHPEQRDHAVSPTRDRNGGDPVGTPMVVHRPQIRAPGLVSWLHSLYEEATEVYPRALTENDLEFLIPLCRKKYGGHYDPVTTENWFRNVVMKTPILFHPVRTKNAFCISFLSVMAWLPGQYECTVLMICAEDGAHFEACKLLRESIEWGRSRKCSLWRVSSETDVDLAPLAKRVGATEESPRWILRY
jgi:hypothetical protein